MYLRIYVDIQYSAFKKLYKATETWLSKRSREVCLKTLNHQSGIILNFFREDKLHKLAIRTDHGAFQEPGNGFLYNLSFVEKLLSYK